MTPTARAVAAGLGNQGVTLGICAPEPVTAAYLCRDLTASGLLALPFHSRPGNIEDIARLLADLATDLGPLDALVDLSPVDPDDLTTGPATPDVPWPALPVPFRLTWAIAQSLRATGRPGRVVLLNRRTPGGDGGGDPSPWVPVRQWAGHGITIDTVDPVPGSEPYPAEPIVRLLTRRPGVIAPRAAHGRQQQQEQR
ncbi:hypothetical protein AB0M87_05510 [Streptomyces sp. NPDC051320]|uniref:hypothetical protein n=1 Tax=Streptomyces sp. NPDC051320 TaxID=3154644 RepID=UPI003414AC5C